jgi:hypothetical protein
VDSFFVGLWQKNKWLSKNGFACESPFFLPAEKANDKIRLRPTFFHFS